LLYPLDHFESKDDTIIIVEGQLDAIRMHKLGYTNTLAPMTVELSYTQCEWVCKHCSTLYGLEIMIVEVLREEIKLEIN